MSKVPTQKNKIKWLLKEGVALIEFIIIFVSTTMIEYGLPLLFMTMAVTWLVAVISGHYWFIRKF